MGAFFIIGQILSDCGIMEKLSPFFKPREVGLLLDLAAYSIISEDNAAQYYPDYTFNHPMFTHGMRRYKDSTVSSFLDGVAFDQTAGFLNKWYEGRSRGEKIYISYDSTNKNCQAGGPGDRRVWQGQGRCQDTGRKGRRGKGKGTPLKGSGCAEVIAEQTGRNAKKGVDAGDCGQRQNLRGKPSFHQELRKSQSSS